MTVVFRNMALGYLVR